MDDTRFRRSGAAGAAALRPAATHRSAQSPSTRSAAEITHLPRSAPCTRLLGASLFILALISVARMVVPFRATAIDEPPFPTNPSVMLLSSNPPDGYIDVRANADSAGTEMGIDAIELTFSEPVVLTEADVSVYSSSSLGPIVAGVGGQGTNWTVLLDGPPAEGSSTALVLFGGTIHVLFHSRPGDVNLDRMTDAADLQDLQAAVSAGFTDPHAQDIDRNGVVDGNDVDALAGMLANGYSGLTWCCDFGPPRVVCCCASGFCNMHVGGGCSDNDDERPCPCAPDPCQGNESTD